MAGKTRAGRKEEIARAIVEELGARTADEAQTPLIPRARQIRKPSTVIKKEPRIFPKTEESTEPIQTELVYKE